MSASRDLDVERKSKLINNIRGFSLDVPKIPIEVFKQTKTESNYPRSNPSKEANLHEIQKIILSKEITESNSKPLKDFLTVEYFFKLCKEADEYNDQFVYAYQSNVLEPFNLTLIPYTMVNSDK